MDNKRSRIILKRSRTTTVQETIALSDSYIDFTQFYYKLFQHAKHLKKNSILFMIYLAQYKMDDNNMVTINKQVRDGFAREMREVEDDILKDRVIHSYIRELVNNSILIQVGKGYYQLNVALIWSGSKTKRIEHLQNFMETSEGKFLLSKLNDDDE